MWFWSLYLLCELHRDENNSRIKKKGLFFFTDDENSKTTKTKTKNKQNQ